MNEEGALVPRDDAGERSSPAPAVPRVMRSEALFAGASQLAILHEETTYILRRTRLGKLILTK
jgi:hemin uptake protein HemP